ncbi:MAG: quinolinate synthase NadA [Rhodospirillales bacterium]|nr:quinolinate synthase NadA [Rhodospirillales bacterium]
MPLDQLYDRVSRVIPRFEWESMEEDVQAILELKKRRKAVILAHNYQTPEIFHGVADIVGDSLALAREAQKVDADIILMAGVHFMAETAKLMNPEKTVLIPDIDAGCSLAESITPEDVAQLRQKYPGRPVVTYVNTSAAVKAMSDICCTSGNAKKIVESLGSPEVIMLPDEFLAQNVAKETNVKILTWKGHCEVHERFIPEDITALRQQYPGIIILTHPECPPGVVEAGDFSGSTAVMANFIQEKKPAQVALITECSMSDNIAQSNPATNFLKPCNLCPHMKRITLKNIRASLEELKTEVTIKPEYFSAARQAVERMLAIK